MSQYRVTLPFEPHIETKNYALWVLTPWEMHTAYLGLVSVPVTSGGSVARYDRYHPTARFRRRPAAPLSAYLQLADAATNACLYHGVGRDQAGVKALQRTGRTVSVYDPYHPDEAVRQPPQDVYDEVFSIYTLNVVNEETAKSILEDIMGLLRQEDSVAVIAVRRDV